jgi:hypothetical protein
MGAVRVRDDDVLIRSSTPDPVSRFKGVHELIVSYGALHVPAIVVEGIQSFPEVLPFIREETGAGRMEPQWHGHTHVDYANEDNKDYEEIRADIRKGQEFFMEHFGVQFTIFYTPWGGNSSLLQKACKEEGVTVVDCSNVVYCVSVNENPELYKGKDVELFIHWYEGKGRLGRALRHLTR